MYPHIRGHVVYLMDDAMLRYCGPVPRGEARDDGVVSVRHPKLLLIEFHVNTGRAATRKVATLRVDCPSPLSGDTFIYGG